MYTYTYSYIGAAAGYPQGIGQGRGSVQGCARWPHGGKTTFCCNKHGTCCHSKSLCCSWSAVGIGVEQSVRTRLLPSLSYPQPFFLRRHSFDSANWASEWSGVSDLPHPPFFHVFFSSFKYFSSIVFIWFSCSAFGSRKEQNVRFLFLLLHMPIFHISKICPIQEFFFDAAMEWLRLVGSLTS